MNVTIENYRGIEIWFDTDNESFQCDIDDARSVKKSYTAIKKFIDDWRKENTDFKPFNVVANPTSFYGGKQGKIIGIRKDGRFILELSNGKKEQVSDYSFKDFMLDLPENRDILKRLNEHLEKVENQQKLDEETKASIIQELNITTLKDVKPNYLPYIL